MMMTVRKLLDCMEDVWGEPPSQGPSAATAVPFEAQAREEQGSRSNSPARHASGEPQQRRDARLGSARRNNGMPEESTGPGSRVIRMVKCFEVLAGVAWLATCCVGFYGMYVGFDTKNFDRGHSHALCSVDGSGSCVATDDHRAVCDACHRAKVDVVMILISFYMILFGVIGIAGSFGILVERRFGFLKSRFGRGFFLFFIGSLAVAQGANFEYTEKYTLIVGVADALIGASVMLSYCLAATGALDPVPPPPTEYHRM